MDADARIARALSWTYIVGACLTLIFQIWTRASTCIDNCAVQYVKAAVWAAVWPLSWAVYLPGIT
jgi:hypothetical protein